MYSNSLKWEPTFACLLNKEEYTALCLVIQEAAWFCLLEPKLGGEILSIILKTDNKASILHAFKPEF